MAGTGHAPIEEAVQRFRERSRSPAVGAALIDADGRLDLTVVGARRCDRPDPVQLDDQWHIGSCTKAVTAATYALLVEGGDTRWSRPVSELFADLAPEIDPGWAAVTIDDVLHGRAGIAPNPTPAAMNAAWADTAPLVDQRRRAALGVLRHPPTGPGRFVYSNLGFILAGAAIDRITATSYEQAVRDLILGPLQVTSAGFGPPPAICGHRPPRLQLAGLSLGRVAPAPPDEPTSDNPPFFNSAGRLHLSLAHWAALQRRLWLDAPDPLLSADSVGHLLQLPADDGMAMGWAPARLDGASYGMQGSNTLWAATALLDQRRRRAALVVANDGRPQVLSRSAELAGEILRSAQRRR